MDINSRFENILIKCGIIEKISFDKAVEIIKGLEEICRAGEKIGLYGVGIEAESLLYFISEHSDCFKISTCFDKTIRNYNYKDIICDTNVYPIESIINKDVDYILLGSYSCRKIFNHNLKSLGYKGKILDLYEYLEEYINNHYSTYETLFKTKQEYLKADGNRIENLKRLIKEYLLIKDFINAFRYIEEYIINKFLGYECYLQLRKELKILLDEIEITINNRNKKDIIINWIDAVSYYDIPSFPFLKNKMKEGVCFENAYTVMPWTTETTKTILFGEYPIEGKLFLKENLSVNNVKLLKVLDESGYKFGYCGMSKFAKLFDETVFSIIPYYENKYSGSMQKQWDALSLLCECDDPLCILVHTLRETHEPFVCGEGETLIYFGSTREDWKKHECRRQAECAGKYINNQLEFYEKLYKKNAIVIYMSDHGRVGNSPMDENKTHVILSVNHETIPHEVIKNMFSLVKFSDMIKILLSENNNWNSLTDTYVLIENLDAYSEMSVRDTLSGRLKKEEMLQCRGIVTERDRYYLYAYGKEYYFSNIESEENEIDNPEYENRIKELKKICGNDFINIYKYKKFEYSRLLYENVELN